MNTIQPATTATRFLAAFEELPLGAALIDGNSGRLVEANPAFAALLGSNRSALAGSSLSQFLETQAVSATDLPWTHTHGPHAAQFDARLRRSGAAPVQVRMTLTPFGLGSTPTEQWLCQIETLATADSAATRKGREDPLLHKLLDHIPVPLAFSSLDAEARVTYLNPAFKNAFGYTLTDIPTVADWARRAYPDARYREAVMTDWQEQVARAIACQGAVESAEFRVTRQDGREREVLISAAVLGDLLLCAFIDQTEQKAREQALRRSERRFRELTEIMHDAVWILEPFTQQLTYVSPSVRRIYGYTAEEMLSQPSDHTLIPEVREAARGQMQQRLEDFLASRQDQKHFYRDELPHLTRSGERGWSETISRFMRDPETGRIELWGVSRDITDRKRAELALMESEERFRLAFDSSNAGMCLVDLKGRLFRVNRRMCELFGYSQAELERMTVDSLTYPEDLIYSRAYIQAALSGETDSAIIEKRYLNREGQIIHALVSPALVRDARGQPLYFITQLQDITESKRIQAALKVSEEKFSRVFQSAVQLMAITRVADGAILEINPAGEAMFGYTRLEMIGKTSLELRLWLEDSQRERFMAELKATGMMSTPREVHFRKKHGEIGTALVTACLLTYGDDAVMLATGIDITERKRMEAALTASEERYRLALEVNNDSVWDWEIPTGRVTGNQRWFDLCAQAPGTKSCFDDWRQRVHPEDRDAVQGRLDAYLQGRSPFYYQEYRLISPTGEILWMLGTGRIVARDAEGRPLRMVGTDADISERKMAEEQIQETLQILRIAARAADIGIWSWNLASGRLHWDERLCHWYAVPEDVLRSGLFYEFWKSRLDPDDRERAEAALMAARRDHTPYDDVFRIRLPDGRVRIMQTSAVFESDANGIPWRVVGINRDITTQRAQETALRESELKYRLIAESMRDVVWTLDLETLRFPYISPSIETMTGYTPAEYLRQPIGAFLTPEAASQLQALLEQRAAALLSGQIPSGQAYVDEVEHPHKDGRSIATEVIMTFWLNDRTGQVEVRGVSRDISERKRVQEALRIAKQEAEHASQAKSAFLANMSHEIRTPMNAVLGLAQLLEQEPLEPDQLAMLRHIREAGDHLLSLINDILDFSKIEAGQLAMDPQPFSLVPLLHHIDHLLRHVAEAKGLRLAIDPAPPGLGSLIADRLRLEQVLVNLINNAIKFTKAGQVSLTVAPMALDAPEPDHVGLRFAVRDTGIGIAPEAQAKLFQSFSQADASITRRFGGTGLGLAISKRIVELMGGRIGVDSREGEGSTFWFELPLRVVAAETAPPEAREGGAPPPAGPRLAGLRVLAVDDNRINLMVLEKALTRQGARVTRAADGQEALNILRANPGDFDVVLMDIQMPVMDGLAATQEIRRDPALGVLPVIALTAGVLAEEREAAQAAGMNDFLAKPLNFERMNAVLSPYLAVR